MSEEHSAEKDVPCTCGVRRVRPYPNDTGHHSTTECIDSATGRVIPPAMCHNGHLFEPGVTVDDAPGESHPDWCNVCGEARVTPPGAQS